MVEDHVRGQGPVPQPVEAGVAGRQLPEVLGSLLAVTVRNLRHSVKLFKIQDSRFKSEGCIIMSTRENVVLQACQLQNLCERANR